MFHPIPGHPKPVIHEVSEEVSYEPIMGVVERT